MRNRTVRRLLVAIALFATVVGLTTAPLAVAQPMATSVAMTMDTDDATPCAHDSNPCPCCPNHCEDMVVCLAGGLTLAHIVPTVTLTPLVYAKVDYRAAAVSFPPDRAPAPISRPPIL